MFNLIQAFDRLVMVDGGDLSGLLGKLGGKEEPEGGRPDTR